MKGEVIKSFFCKKCRTTSGAVRHFDPKKGIVTYKCLNPDCGYITIVPVKTRSLTKAKAPKRELKQTTLLSFFLNWTII